MRALLRMALALMLAAVVANAHAAQEPLPFVSGSLDRIIQAQGERPFMLVMWSLDCVYCRHDLEMLGRLRADYPSLRLVLVSTDVPERRGEILPALEALSLGAEESWIFADSFTDRLLHQIDPRWSGELPRTYFYSGPGEERIGISGKLDEAAVEDWIRAVYGAS